MKKFIQTISLILLVMLVYMTGMFLLNKHRLTDEYLVEEQVVFIGDSHIKTGLDPEFYTNSINLSAGAENYVVSYYKIKKLIRENRTIEKVILGLSYHNLAVYQDMKLTSSRAKNQFLRFHEILPISLPNEVDINKTKFYHTFIRELALFPNNSKIRYVEGFSPFSIVMNEKGFDATIAKHFERDKNMNVISSQGEKYLESIRVLCEQNEVELILVGTPLHQKYQNEVPAELIDYYNETTAGLKERGVRILDHQRLEFPDSLFRDQDHLNKFGAERFTKMIADES